MKFKYKRALSILLVIIFMLTIVSPVMQTPAEAANPVIAIEAVSLIVWILGLLGITFATTGAQYQSAQQAYVDIPELKAWIEANTVNVNSVTAKFLMTRNALIQLYETVLPKVKEYFNNKESTVQVAQPSVYAMNSVIINKITGSETWEQLYNLAQYNTDTKYTIIRNGVNLTYELKKGTNQVTLYRNDSPVIWQYSALSLVNNTYETCEYKLLFALCNSSTVYWINPVILAKAINKDTGTITYRFAGTLTSDYQNNSGTISLTSLDELLPTHKPVEYQNAISFDLSEMQNTLNKILGQLNEISIPLDDPNWDATHGKTEVENPDTAVPAVPTTNWAEIWDALGIKDLIKTLTQNKPVTIEESDFKAPQLPTSIIDKFPFCVPFDLIAIVQTLNATPVAPSFTIPMRFDSINYTENFTIDLSGNDWNRVGKVIRWGNTLLFLAGLILITRKVIQA